MLIQDVNPFLRCALRFRYSVPSSVRCPADARILYILDGAGTLSLAGTEYPVVPGTLALIGAGFVYRLELDSPLELIALNFDYTWDRRKLDVALKALPPDVSDQVEKVRFEDCDILSSPVIVQKAQPFQNALEEIVAVFKTQKCYYREESAGLLKALLTRIARMALLADPFADALADRLIQYLQEHYRENLTVKEIAYHFNYHDGHINRIMRSATGTTIHSYLILCRMNAAKSFLLGTDMTVSQIAEAVGMKSDAYFCNSFKKMVGISPNEYRCRFKNK